VQKDNVIQGACRAWLRWRWGGRRLREAAYNVGRFRPEARRLLDRYLLVEAPVGVAWFAAKVGSRLPGWLTGGAVLATPAPSAACLHPLPVIAGFPGMLSPALLAHEFTHVLWHRVPRALRAEFPAALARAEAEDPRLAAYLARAMAGYRDSRSTYELFVRVVEYYHYGREPVPEAVRPYYAAWIDLEAAPLPPGA
jgi:hypothetical protein